MSSVLYLLPSAPAAASPRGSLVPGPICCQIARCKCGCGCNQHPSPSGGPAGHFARCDDCAHGWHEEPAYIRAMRAFGELPPSPRSRHVGTVDRLGHLLPRGPRREGPDA